VQCPDVQPQLTAYLSGNLAVEDGRMVDIHLASCARCQDELKALRHTWEGLADLPAPSLPSALDRQVLGAVAREAVGSRSRPAWVQGWWGIALAACVAAAISLGGSLLLPYETAFQWCSRTLRNAPLFRGIPDSSLFLLVGIVYGLLPLLAVGLWWGRRFPARPLRHGAAAAAVFSGLVLPYALIVCSSLPAPLSLSLVAGMLLGALAGGPAGISVGTHRRRLVELPTALQ
jgi:hypothetical protein